MLSTSRGSAAVEVSGCLGPHFINPPHPETFSSMRLVSSEEAAHISRTLPVNVGYPESTFQTQSEMKYEFHLPELCSQKQGCELTEHTHTVQEFPQPTGTESDLSVKIGTFNINFPKDVPLNFVRNIANKHRSSVHLQSDFDLKFIPETLPVQSTKLCHLPVEKALPVNVSEVGSLILESSAKTPDLQKPKMISTMAAQTETDLPLIIDLLSHEDTDVRSSQVASGDESVNYITNPEEITVKCKNLQTAASNCTETEVSRGGSQLENGVEQIISEVPMQENLLETTANLGFHSKLKNEIQAAPISETHVNIFTVLPHEETMIELLPRKKTGKICINNEIRTRVEQGSDSKTFENSNLQSSHVTIAGSDVINSICTSGSADELSKTRLMSPTSPISVKPKNATKNSIKLEDSDDFLRDYKWPDQPFFKVTEQLETTKSGDSKWSDVWPIDSVHNSCNPEERDCLLSPTNCFADDVFKFPYTQNFDDDIEVNDFVDDSSRHSLHEIEESIGQLISDVEMDETQLMKQLSCFKNPVVRNSDVHENDDVMNEHVESEITISNTAIAEKPWKKGHMENRRPVRAEVKLLVKTCETGKEAIEIRSMKEYWDDEMAHGQQDSSTYVSDLKASTCKLENFQEQLDLPQNSDSSAKNIPEKLMQSSSEFTNDERILHSCELAENELIKLKIFENIKLNDLSKNVESMSSLGDLEEGYTSVSSQGWQDDNMKFFHLSRDGKLLDDTALQKQKTSKQGKREENQIQRLFIRSPNLTLTEPLNMLPSEGNMKQQSSAAKIRPHEIKKLLVRSQNYEDFITFPIVTPPSSLPCDLKPPSIMPTPPPQHLPKTKLFENLPRVPLASDEDLRSLSSLNRNISLKNIFFSFLPIDDISDIPDGLNPCTSFARWMSMPSVTVRKCSFLSNGIPLRGTTLHPLTRAVSMPSLQRPVCPIATELHETHVSSYHRSDAEPKDWASLHSDEAESSLIIQSSSDPNQTNSSSSVPVSTFSRSDTLPVFGQPSGFSRRCPMKFFSSPSSSSSSLHTEIISHQMSPDLYKYHGQKSPNTFNSMSLNNCPSLMTTSPRSSGSPRQCNQKSDTNTLTCSQTIFSNTQGELDPWYLQTEFLLSPLVIPSGYCTWVPTPDQQTYSRGKEGVNFEISTLQGAAERTPRFGRG
jgi:hypothetical protein